MNKVNEYLIRLPFWEQLTSEEKELLYNNAYIRKFDKGSYVLRSRVEEDIGLMMLVGGKIRAFLLSKDGKEISLFSLYDNSICVFSAISLFKQITFQVFLVADCDCNALVINMSILERLMNNNIYFRCFAYELMAERFSSVMDSVQWILFHGLEKRLAAFLVGEYDRHRKKYIRATHSHIATHIGTSRERVTKTLKKLHEKGLICRSKGCVEITDILGLRDIAMTPDFSRE